MRSRIATSSLRPRPPHRGLGIGRREIGCIALLALLALCAAPGRATSESERLARILELAPGKALADVGAGDGRWSEALAAYVEPGGVVYSTEVEEGLEEEIRQRMERAGLSHVVPVLGSQQGSGLEASCCDAMLLRLVYHHFTDPAGMLADLSRALKPSGLLAVVDILPQSHWRHLPEVPDRGGHGISPEGLIEELEAAGFELVERFDDWNQDPERYCLLFRPAPDTPTQSSVAPHD